MKWVRYASLLFIVVVHAGTSWADDAASRAHGLSAYGMLPMRFERNQGQTDPRVKFLVRASAYTLFLTRTEAVIARAGKPAARVTLLGASPESELAGEQPQEGRSHYFLGSEPARWHRDIEAYSRVRLHRAYPGIDLVYYGRGNQLEYDFVVSPGATPQVITFGFQGISRLHVDGDGDLILTTSDGEIRHRKPRIYQVIAGVEHEVKGRYVVTAKARVRFEIDKYNKSETLVIDPVLDYSTYLGGSGDDSAYGIAIGTAGCAYIVGETSSVDFPNTGAEQFSGTTDIFVSKLNKTGTALVYSVYLGGSSQNSGRAIAVDASGNAYITGFTYSQNFPVTAGAYQASWNGTSAAFAAKLNAAGSALVYSTYIAGSSSDYGESIAVDGLGNAYVAGYTSSLNFPTTGNAFQTAYGGGYYDAFVAKLNTSGTALSYSTYLGGSGIDTAYGIAVDSSGCAYVTGQTASVNFPVQNPIQPNNAGNIDTFVTKLNAAGTGVIYSTYLGGSGVDAGVGIALDSAGDAYITGSTDSLNFPTTSGAFQTMNNGGYDLFVTELNAAGNSLIYSTELGGSGSEEGGAIAVDAAGNAYVVGTTNSTDFPMISPLAAYGGGYDAVVAVLNAGGSALRYDTYLGGSSNDYATAVAIDPASDVYVTGYTFSDNFPTRSGAFQQAAPPPGDAFITRVLSDSVMADFNGDGIPDLIWQNVNTRAVTIWYMTGPLGNTVLGTGSLAPSELGWTLRAIADINRDGVPDLIWQNDATRQVIVWYMTGPLGNTMLSWSQLAPPEPGWTLVGVADVNRDGIQDLVWQNDSSTEVIVWYMGGSQYNTMLSWAELAPPEPGWAVVGLADLNRDGIPDLVWQNESTGQVEVWYMTGSQGNIMLSWASISGPEPGWTAIGMVDVNRDGIPDLVWQNANTGQVEVWYMSGPLGNICLNDAWLSAAPQVGLRAVGY
jgi:Beta-propeller repeat/FG-GAP-like repeat